MEYILDGNRFLGFNNQHGNRNPFQSVEIPETQIGFVVEKRILGARGGKAEGGLHLYML